MKLPSSPKATLYGWSPMPSSSMIIPAHHTSAGQE
eukprot:CAMPEP_0177731600 /NCGR_PEP_ID=MMETSP0484_2-20121128/22642_1 /TAXON_ID=354590 /ORGANISM="Rhodomonas lens, Strain RHODO" /LENGTH=34 /DNA_ID= /DNA_START= /DNA_END= /DNA_ORIENTATION=